jgi:hypothetical protein
MKGAIPMFGKPRQWTVMRWSGRDGDAPRKVFAGPEEKARAEYVKLYKAMRQGTVELFDANGEIMDRSWAPRKPKRVKS